MRQARHRSSQASIMRFMLFKTTMAAEDAPGAKPMSRIPTVKHHRRMVERRFKNPSQVIGFNTAERWSRDVSENVAHELLQRCADQGWLFPESLAQFVDGHAGQNRALDMHLTFCAWLFQTSTLVDVAIAGLRLVLAGGVYRPYGLLDKIRGSTALPVWPQTR
jgi:hypothetical protein